jgi:hypothetical protein
VRIAGVEAELGYCVCVAFGVGLEWGGGVACVPVFFFFCFEKGC